MKWERIVFLKKKFCHWHPTCLKFYFFQYLKNSYKIQTTFHQYQKLYSTPPWHGARACKVSRKYLNAFSSYSAKTKRDGQTDGRTDEQTNGGRCHISRPRAYGMTGDKKTTVHNYIYPGVSGYQIVEQSMVQQFLRQVSHKQVPIKQDWGTHARTDGRTDGRTDWGQYHSSRIHNIQRGKWSHIMLYMSRWQLKCNMCLSAGQHRNINFI